MSRKKGNHKTFQSTRGQRNVMTDNNFRLVLWYVIPAASHAAGSGRFCEAVKILAGVAAFNWLTGKKQQIILKIKPFYSK